MTIPKIVSSLAFLMSLSLAAVASEKHDFIANAPFAFEPKEYVVKDNEVIRFDSALHMQNLKNYLEANKENYFKIYKNNIPPLVFEQAEHVFLSYLTGEMISFATNLTTGSSLISGCVFFSMFALSMSDFPTQTSVECHERAKMIVKNCVLGDLHNQKLVKNDYDFFSNDSEQFFNQFIDKLMNPSAPKK